MAAPTRLAINLPGYNKIIKHKKQNAKNTDANGEIAFIDPFRNINWKSMNKQETFLKKGDAGTS